MLALVLLPPYGAVTLQQEHKPCAQTTPLPSRIPWTPQVRRSVHSLHQTAPRPPQLRLAAWPKIRFSHWESLCALTALGTQTANPVAGWCRAGPSGPVWSRLGPSGTVWRRLASSGVVWGRLEPSATVWRRLVPSRPVWTLSSHLGLYGVVRRRLAPTEAQGQSGTVWCRLEPSGAIWARLRPSEGTGCSLSEFYAVLCCFHYSLINWDIVCLFTIELFNYIMSPPWHDRRLVRVSTSNAFSHPRCTSQHINSYDGI